MVKKRCDWEQNSELMIQYHDHEWGVPLHNDQGLFEFLCLESFQAGLSWEIVLKKRENFRKAFDGFDPKKIVKYDDLKVDELMHNAGIIRNIQKIRAVLNNATCFLKVQQEFGSFDFFIWSFINNKPVINTFNSLEELPAKTELSERIARELKKRGFKFLGPTVVYAHMQATGMVNDHLVSCFRYKELNEKEG